MGAEAGGVADRPQALGVLAMFWLEVDCSIAEPSGNNTATARLPVVRFGKKFKKQWQMHVYSVPRGSGDDVT